MCSGSEAGLYLRPIDSCITQLKAQKPSRSCNESNKTEEVLTARACATRAGFERRFRVQGSGFRVQGSGFRVQGSGLRVQGSGFRVQGSGLRFEGSRFRSEACVTRCGWRAGLGSLGSGLGFRV